MPIPIIALGGVFLVLLIILIAIYNSLVSLKNHIKESWADIDVQMKRRYDLIPNLVETVKGYAAHEKEVFEKVTEARNKAFANNGRYSSQSVDENAMIGTLKTLFAVSERYPELKANENFLKLQQELVDTEDKIAAARRFFNGNIRDYNNKVQMFPSSIIAGMFGFKAEDFFEVEDDAVRNAVKVNI
ncbi:MAG: LemA family protein [Planctomycetes bacterium]|nr:LemA family protein [Planctomycetota bacterium]